MNFVSDPALTVKIERMAERVRWGDPLMRERGIDQTRLAFEQPGDPELPFSFLVLGDSGTGHHRRSSPQRQVAQWLMEGGEDARFLLHTGDVVYLVGSSEQYRDNFIEPYREWLVGEGRRADGGLVAYDQMVFRLPFLPVPGNHDYYDLPWPLALLSGLTWPLRQLLRHRIDLDVGWHGSFAGDAYARAFFDYLRAVPDEQLPRHLERHYRGGEAGARCLLYRPGQHTRLPNRYYRFRYAGVDVFALDSNTFNQPLPGRVDRRAPDRRRHLEGQRQRLLERQAELLRAGGRELLGLGETVGDRALDGLPDDRLEELEEIEEQLRDIAKQGEVSRGGDLDREQLDWLRDGLVASWRDPAARGRLLVLHHPPYTTEASKWFQGQTMAVRQRLRDVLDAVAREVGPPTAERPLVNLAMAGHAHCLEILRTGDTGHGDGHIPWVICGGGGYSLRRQRTEGRDLWEGNRRVAGSELFLGRSGSGGSLLRPYSGLRVDVRGGTPLQLTLTPLVAEKREGRWRRYRHEPLTLGGEGRSGAGEGGQHPQGTG